MAIAAEGYQISYRRLPMSRERTPQVGRGGCCWLLFQGGMGVQEACGWAASTDVAGPVASASLFGQTAAGHAGHAGL